MLREISVSNLAIIEDVKVRFQEGLNILTGETGAGKSILVGAIMLVLGRRASSEMIRTGCKSALIQAVFELKNDTVLAKSLSKKDIEFEDELIMRRVISKNGNNRVYLNETVVPLSTLKELGEHFVNVYGQHESQGLMRPETHLEILDAFGGLTSERDKVLLAFDQAKKIEGELKALQKMETERIAREDYLKFQIREIKGAGIKAGELEELELQRKKLQSAEKLAQIAKEALMAAYDNEGSIYEQAQTLAQRSTKMEEIDPEFKALSEELDQIALHAQEVSSFCSSYLSRLQNDPAALEKIEDRVHEIRGIIRKYGGSEEAVLETLGKAESEIEAIASLSKNIETKDKELTQAKSSLLLVAQRLSKGRQKAAKRMSNEIGKELAELDMPGASFDVSFFDLDTGGIEVDGKRIDADGMERGEFLLAANPGEGAHSLAKIASGGELSRILLAIKNALARNFYVPTLVFDEVDAGIGGKQAETVGRKLKDVSEHHQILCITHLPQIAAKADHHFKVKKQVVKGRTVTEVVRLSQKDREEEVARLLSGEKVTDATKAVAKEMITG